MKLKSGQATYIAPLQPPILAPFPAWGSSEGAGRIRLAQRKSRNIFSYIPNLLNVISTEVEKSFGFMTKKAHIQLFI